KEALRQLEEIEKEIFKSVQNSKTVQMLGLEVLSVNVLGVTPNPEMARALEAQTRESLQKEADQAVYERRNFAVEQERIIQESELNTEIAVEEKQKQIVEKKMETDIVKQENDQKLNEMEMTSSISLEEQKKELIDIQVTNEKKEADVKEYVLNANLKPYKELDWKTLMAISNNGNDPSNNIALAFRELAENADKIGNLNISPELLDSIVRSKS
ncbi:MAG: SPFH domain-containing protein, partial [Flavobacteriaceae bacterium]|nr:SPFH domain-containing protein [Flavobacteriaceae bacterium]